MFIRSTLLRDRKTKKEYKAFRLVESYRNQSGGARQRTLLHLGSKFSIPQEQWKLLADRIEEIGCGQQSLFAPDDVLEKEARRIAKILVSKQSDTLPPVAPSEPPLPNDFQTVDINSLDHSDVRKIGSEYLGSHAATQLQLRKTLLDAGFNTKQANTAIGSIIGRLVCPGSELSTHRYLTEHSALDELLETDFSTLPLNNLYSISDQLLANKAAIESALYQREKDLFNLEEVVTLYDITNTYFEGRCSANPKAKHGRSKEKRSDCPLVALGMVLDASGFPKKSDTFPGNVSEPGTMAEILKALGALEGSTIVMDAGFASEENISWLRESGYDYIVVSRKRKLDVAGDDIASVLVKEDQNNRVEVQLVENADSNELELYCHSTAKEAKSAVMVDKARTQYQDELDRLSAGLTKKGCTKDYKKVIERIGRLKEKYSRVSRFYDVTVTSDADKKVAISITWECKASSPDNKHYGTYCLRTNRKDLDEKTFWKTYTMLTDLEAAFRSLKSELGMRPVYHQKESRVDGHIFITILAYHLLHTIRYQLTQKGITSSWHTIRQVMQTQCRITTTMQLHNGKAVQVRKTASPDVNQSIIYDALGLKKNPGGTKKIYR
jgi:transposase